MKKSLPAVILAGGENAANYESVEMLAGVAPAVRTVMPGIAEAMYRRVDSLYSGGLWAEPDNYYIQNWAWFGAAFHHHYMDPFERVLN